MMKTDALKRLFEARRHYCAGWFALLRRFVLLAGPERYSPNEIFLLGLLDPALERGALSKFVSKERLLRVQSNLNPRSHYPLTEDKVVFYSHCCKNGLPTPSVFGVWGEGSSPPPGVPRARTAAELEALCCALPKDDFVLKPVGGVHGEGVMLLRRNGNVVVDEKEREHSAEMLVKRMASTGYQTWLLQARLYAAPGLAELSGARSLQTARVVTFVDRHGEARVLFAWLRILGGTAVFDNFNFGDAGNFVATLDPRTARVSYALARARDGFGLEEVGFHPITGHPFRGFELPHGRTVFDLALDAARCFAPLRTIGWDVAITPEGVSLIEGNVTWDPLPTREDLGALVGVLKRD